MKINVKITATWEIQHEEYHVPADEKEGEEREKSVETYIEELEGVKIKSIKTIHENRYDK